MPRILLKLGEAGIAVDDAMRRECRLLSALAPSMMNSRQTLGLSPRSIRLSTSACTVLGCAFDQGERMFVAFSINAEGCDQHQVIADVQPIDLDNQEVHLG
jgi:hypothetical protein